MKEIINVTQWIRLYIAGDPNFLKHETLKWALEAGACVTVTATDYIYTGGMESGVIIGFNKYPKFPYTKLYNQAFELGKLLMEACGQQTFMIQEENITRWYSRRKYDLE